MKQLESDDLISCLSVFVWVTNHNLNVFFDDNVVEIGSVVGNPLTLSIKTKLFQASFCSVFYELQENKFPLLSKHFLWTSFCECEKLSCSYFASENSSSLVKRSYHIVPCTEFLRKLLQFTH